MMEWVAAAVPYFKALHIGALLIWCSGLIAMPLMLTRHRPADTQDDYRRIRRATHLTYTTVVTPAAVIAVIAGTWLIFLRETFMPWLYVKLFFVVMLVCGHAWIGHILVTVAESSGRQRAPAPYLPLVVLLTPMLAILFFVLGKPDLGSIQLPDWISEPRGGQLPFDVPRR